MNELEKDFEEENPTGKKKRKGRRLFREISRINVSVRLLNKSKMHIEKMVRDFKRDDPNFATESAAVRHYVNIGIAAETATSDLRNSLDNYIVRKSQKLAVRDELKPLVGNIKKNDDFLIEFKNNTDRLLNDLATRSEKIEAKLDAGIEANNELIKLLKGFQITGEQSLRNIIVLRTILYIFLIGHKTGNIAPGKENEIQWSKLVRTTHSKANALSIAEIKMLSSEVLEADIIQKMAIEIFNEIT